MDSNVDLNRLPIPDWDLTCPGCGYALKFLAQHRCPECGAAFDMEDVAQTWSRVREPRFCGDELPVPDFGLSCERCGGELAGARARQCPHCKAVFDLQDRRPAKSWFTIAPHLFGKLQLSLVEHLLAGDHIPFIHIDSKTVGELYMGGHAVGRKLTVSSEFYFDMCHLLRRTQHEIEQKRQAGEGLEWRCPACGEEVPGHFDLCWNCQAERAG